MSLGYRHLLGHVCYKSVLWMVPAHPLQVCLGLIPSSSTIYILTSITYDCNIQYIHMATHIEWLSRDPPSWLNTSIPSDPLNNRLVLRDFIMGITYKHYGMKFY